MPALHDNSQGDLPPRTFTFLFTDVQGSTRLWEEHPDAMRVALARHDALLRASIEKQNGRVFKTAGDAFHAAFASAHAALAAALAAQSALHAEQWPLPGSAALRVRMALHAGVAEERAGDFFGAPLGRVARLLAAAHGGQTLVSEPLAALAAGQLGPDISLRSLGRHRFKDLAQPQEVFQLVHPALPQDFPPLRSLEAFTHNLPSQLSSFIGRDGEMSEARRLLAETRLLTLTGTGGAGKTRLALQAAAEAVEDYPDGVWLVDLAPLSDPALLTQTVAAVLGVGEEGGARALMETLADALRPKSLLLVWDNCEHLIDACARLAETLLRACPGLHLLATSREALEIGGEVVLPVSSLALPPVGPHGGAQAATPETLAGCDSVRLFVERATTALPTFRLSAGNAPAVALVCTRLDGIPLALELAAARVRVLTPEQIAARLDDRFRLLSGGSRTALPRQQTLRALIDWSYDLLPGPEKTLLRRLSVFAGGLALEAAESVCLGGEVAEWEVLDLLSRLVAKSLVLVEPPDAGRVRYRLLENLRSYACERLTETEETDAVAARHAAWFLAFAEEAEAKLSGPEQAAWLDQLERDHDNLRAALVHSHDSEGNAEVGLRLSGAMWKFWWMRGYFSEGRHFLGRALSRSDGEDTVLRARVLSRIGIIMEAQGDYMTAIARHKECLGIYRNLKDDFRIALALNSLGNIASSRSDWESARDYYGQGLIILRAQADEERMAVMLMNTGIVANHQQEYAEARSLYEESLEIFRRRQDLGPLTAVLSNLGELACNQGDYASARAHLLEGLQLAERLGEKECIASILMTFGYTAWPLGQYEQAAKLFGAAAGILNAAGFSLAPRDQSSFEENVAIVRAELGERKFLTAWRQGEGVKPKVLVNELL